mgnify:CR=1 FL=1
MRSAVELILLLAVIVKLRFLRVRSLFHEGHVIVNGIIRLYSFDCFRIDTGVKLAQNILAITVLCYLQAERDVG